MAQVVGEFLVKLFGPSLEVLRFAGPLVTPELAGVPEYFLQFQPKAAGSSRLGFQHFVDISLQMVQALLLVHVGQLIRLVAFAAVGYHHPRVVGGNQFSHLFIAMLASNLKHGGLVRVEGHQMRGLPVNSPARVIGVGYRRQGYTCSQLLVDRKSTRLNSSHGYISYAVFCLKKKKKDTT